jgi:hypothetical protein
MAEGDSADKLSAKRHFVLVLRVVVEGGGKVTGELVDPSSDRRRRFNEITELVDEVRDWIDDVIRQASPG